MKYLEYVNIKHGTDSQNRFSNGNTLPLTALPHSMSAFAPQTDSRRGSWWYHPKDHSFEGIRLTHQPSPWVSDFSYFCFMPQADRLACDVNQRWSGFRPQDAVLKPHYLEINLLRYRCKLSLAPTDTGSIMKVVYEDSIKKPLFAVLPFDFDSEIDVDEKNSTITGYTTSYTNSPYNKDFKIWFIFKIDKPIYNTINSTENAKGTGVFVKDNEYTVRMATSYISLEQAKYNLEKELEGKSFEDIKNNAEKVWENLLSKVEIKADDKMMRTFYSCMYRAFLYPTKFYETTKDGENLHVNAETGEIKKGIVYTNNGFWDTYRTVYPFYSLVIPEKINEILEGYLTIYDDTGFLPRWPSPYEFGCMPGTLIEAVFADAIIKGLLTKENEIRALEAMLKNARVQSSDIKQGRKAIKEYETLGYVPYDVCHESVNETLDCAYGDFCIAVVAEKLGKTDIANEFYNRSKNYRNLFDNKTMFIRAKDSKGNFRQEEFDSFSWGMDYTEGSVWQNGFAVPHDMNGVAELYGGKKALIDKIDLLTKVPPYYSTRGYGGEIHEMTEMAAIDFGQCAISNQPSFHIPFIYSQMGDRKKTEEYVQKIILETFSPDDDGYPGDEDNGTMACWYIFACLGLYPTCPGKAEYTLSKTLVKSAKINNKIFNASKFKGNTVKHSQIIEG